LVLTVGVLIVSPSTSASLATTWRAFTAKELPQFVLGPRDMPSGLPVYDSGYGVHFEPNGAVTLFGFEYDGHNRAATSVAFLFRTPRRC
jgi:hypothetical protein